MPQVIDEIYLKFANLNGFSYDFQQMDLIDHLEKYAKQINKTKKLYDLLKFFSFHKYAKSSLKGGMYIWGDVGRGKTMIIDLFYESLIITNKKRIHFHQFMLNTHKKLGAMNQSESANDHLITYAQTLSKKYKVIILDELQINNIADAMIVGRLFTLLLNLEVYIFFTSNRIPSDLFKDGLQREFFLPFIDVINSKLEIFNLNNPIDYRMQNFKVAKTYIFPNSQINEKLLKDIINSLTGSKPLQPLIIKIDNDRQITAYKSYGHIAVFSFKELCEVPLGANDYLALCKVFNLIIITDIPKLSIDNHNELLRFITLIDCLYDNHKKLICFADVSIEEIYISGKHAFEFQRTISRLKEMHSEKYFNNHDDGIYDNQFALNI